MSVPLPPPVSGSEAGSRVREASDKKKPCCSPNGRFVCTVTALAATAAGTGIFAKDAVRVLDPAQFTTCFLIYTVALLALGLMVGAVTCGSRSSDEGGLPPPFSGRFIRKCLLATR